MKAYDDITQLIGRTPLLRLARIAPDAKLYGKCEFLNPLSIKDRPVFEILEEARQDGRIQKGSTVIECTSGNTGMAVASIAAVHGYRAILVMSEIQSLERRRILAALGAELVLTPASEGTVGAKRKLDEILAENPDYFYVGQHQNPANVRAHHRTTGPEIWADTDGTIDLLVAPLGTGGTLCGAGGYLKEQNANVQVIGVEPEESPFISQGIFRPHRMMGTAPGFVPKTLNRELLDDIGLVNEDDAFAMVRQLAETEGILVGISSGAAVTHALRLSQQPEHRDQTIVVVLADSGQRYLSVDGLFPAGTSETS